MSYDAYRMRNAPVLGEALQFYDDLRQPWGNPLEAEGRPVLSDMSKTEQMEALGNYLPVVDSGGLAGMFAGIGAKTANKLALKKAQEMQGKGATRDEVWKETGWFNDVDGKWKFEIDDSGANLVMSNRSTNPIGPPLSMVRNSPPYKGPLSGYMSHPKLENAYDQSRTKVREEKGNEGSFVRQEGMTVDGKKISPNFDELSIGWSQPTKEIKSTVLHELQHGIQGREGFAMGGSSSNITKGIKDASDRYSKQRDTLEQSPWGKEVTTEMMQKYGVESPELAQSMWGRDLPDSDFLELFSKDPQGLAYFLKNDSRVGALGRERQDALDSLHGTVGYGDDPFKVYQRLAGEAEARNVQTRMDFTPDERMARPPWSTLDVPENELLVRGVLDGN